MNTCLEELNKKFFDPLFQSSGLTSEDQKILKNIWNNILLSKSVIVICLSIPEAGAHELGQKYRLTRTIREKVEVLNSYLDKYPETKEILKKYFKEELPKELSSLINSFTSKAAGEQKELFMQLLAKQNPTQAS